MEQARSRTRSTTLIPAVAALFALALAPAVGHAQQGSDSRWLPWLGCWEPAQPQADDMLVCTRPAGSGVEIATIAGSEIASTRTLTADAQRHAVTEEGCTGWESAEFSRDGRRVYLRSERSCEGGIRRTASAIMAMNGTAEWIDAQSIGLGDERMPRVVTYRPASSERARSAGFAIPADRIAAAGEARLLASMDLTLDDVREAATKVDGEAVEVFLIERGQSFDLDGGRVVALADAGVPPNVIDVVVAVSYPGRFQIDRDAMRMALQPEQRAEDDQDPRDRFGGYDPFGWGYYGGSRWRSCAGYSFYDSLYCDRFGYGGYGGFGYGYGYNGLYGYGWGRPIIIVDGDGEAQPPGRVVNGRGYTRGGRTTSGSSGRRADPPSGSTSGSRPGASTVTSGGSGSSGAASSGGYTRGGSSKGSTGSSGRTAKKKGGGGL